MNTVESVVPAGVYEKMVTFRRDLHRHPELSHEEKETAGRIVDELERLGIPYRTEVGGHGIVADLPGENDDYVVALRSDMDALPIQEETGLEFASVHDGVMHACGHDGHTSMLLGAAHLLLQEPSLPAPVRLIWQPAEETGMGAQAMVRDGAMENVRLIFGGHLDRHYPAGELIVTEGAVNASTDAFEIHIRGQQGHGARPHETVDAVVVGSLFVTALQTLVSREINPAYPSVVTVGTFAAGTAPNVIAGTATLTGTIRSQDAAVREHLLKSLHRMARAIGDLHGAEISVRIHSGTPPVINTREMATLARRAAERVVHPDHVRPLVSANMGGEDFAYFLDHAKGCYIRFGARVEGREGFPTHSSQFDFDERALAVGAAWYAEVAKLAGRTLTTGG